MPPADNSAFLLEATQRRSREARARAEKAITAAQKTRKPVTVAGIARTANVSRSWLYTKTDLVAAINQIKEGAPSPARTGPQPASIASLRARLDAALTRVKDLRAANADLTKRLETAHGEIRRLRIDASS
ncbi:DUF6262 family protein [Umezawaea sp. Da 62-37]|uniref:DUF6262 family protein n=1 Tax=Umezawaea sp. Da 62-37 TaxID=3075927 RepID=UPI0028F710CC|nr:DUF6262 family protein [Umezawaea sp. Da 62-37]WNV83143.1 DUF6262 family protein [Umezawaea sp. Da 62-37]WNV85070.1 DUF6262 family protein [Umezawaea sp. Da 62-37]